MSPVSLKSNSGSFKSVREFTGQGELRNGFHGDVRNKHKFRIVPLSEPLEYPFDTHEHPNKFCNNCVRLTPVLYQC